jgi:hypothetical protein
MRIWPWPAQGAAQPDLRPAFEDGDDHDAGHPDGAGQQRDRAQAEEQGAGRGGDVELGRQGGPGLETCTWSGYCGLARAASRLSTAVTLLV